MKRIVWGVVIGIGVVAIAATGIWLSRRGARGYEGLANRYPASTAAFVEINELGQWMNLPPEPEGASRASSGSRGTDPMLQVLGQVWAAQPVRPSELPEMLRHQPMAVGLWSETRETRGAAVILLAPGQADSFRAFLAKKLGRGKARGSVDGVSLFETTALPIHDENTTFVWGVSEDLAVVATGPAQARTVLHPSGESLAKTPAFLTTIRQLPSEKGAFLFVQPGRMADFANLVKTKKGCCEKKDARGDEGESAEGTPPETPGESPRDENEKHVRLGEISKVIHESVRDAAKKIVPLDAIEGFGLWTAPPAPGQEGWRVASWLGFKKDQAAGIWRLVSEGRERYPGISGNLPKDGLVYIWNGGKDPAQLYRVAMEELRKDLPQDQVGWIMAGIGAAEGKLGVSFANELLPSLGDESCLVVAGDPKGGEKDRRMGFFFSLRDARRFEDMVATKLAPQLHFAKTTLQGADVWTYGAPTGDERAPSLVVSGGMAVVTNDPSWAISTGGKPGKAFSDFASVDRKASGIAVVDPGLWSKENQVFVKVLWHTTHRGLSLDARFPGEPPSWKWKEMEKAVKGLYEKPVETL